MHIGIPKETKPQEARVALTPAGVRELVKHHHDVFIERGAGIGSGFSDDSYMQAGANLVGRAVEVFEASDMVIKVKEPQPDEYTMLREGQIVFAYLHLAPDPEQTRGLVNSGCVAIAYETVTDAYGGLPLLSPMSEVAGRLSVQAGAMCLENIHGGTGLLLGGVPGVPGARVVVIGGGVVGSNALRIAVGLGAQVTVLDTSVERLRQLDALYVGRLNTLYANTENVEKSVEYADLIIGAVLLPGAASPKVVTHEMISRMRPGSTVVDVAIDQGGCFETSRPTSHSKPTYEIEGVVHYCVTNIPGCVARTSTLALTNATLPFILQLADKGYCSAMAKNSFLRNGLNVHRGIVTNQSVADNLGYEYQSRETVLGLYPSMESN